MKKILIIEDETEIQELLRDLFLCDLGEVEAVYAMDGLEGFACANREKFDLICTDHMMPLCKGADFMLALRDKSGINQNTPIILISANIPHVPERLHALENTYFVSKPIDFERLKRYAKMAMR
jgi:two-component system sensor histidine kinase BarA